MTIAQKTCGLIDAYSGYSGLAVIANDVRKLPSPRLQNCGIEADATVR